MNTSVARVGFIGLGSMGTPMALNLLRAGNTLSVYARRPDALSPLTVEGAQACPTPAAVAAQSDVVFTMVTDTAAVEAVTLGPDGIVEGAASGAVVIDHSTIDPEVTKRIAATLQTRGIDMLDAPVSGGVMGAQSGRLVMMVGGRRDVFDRCSALLSVNAHKLVHMGPSGSGQVAKACNQICIVVNQLGVAEALLLAERSGLDASRLIEALSGGFAASRILEVQGPKMAQRDFTGHIESRLHHKDILVALGLAARLGLSLPASSLAADILDRLQQAGGAKSDSAAVVTVLEGLEPI